MTPLVIPKAQSIYVMSVVGDLWVIKTDSNKFEWIMLNTRWVKTILVHFIMMEMAGGAVYWYSETLSSPKMFLDNHNRGILMELAKVAWNTNNWVSGVLSRQLYQQCWYYKELVMFYVGRIEHVNVKTKFPNVYLHSYPNFEVEKVCFVWSTVIAQ